MKTYGRILLCLMMLAFAFSFTQARVLAAEEYAEIAESGFSSEASMTETPEDTVILPETADADVSSAPAEETADAVAPADETDTLIDDAAETVGETADTETPEVSEDAAPAEDTGSEVVEDAEDEETAAPVEDTGSEVVEDAEDEEIAAPAEETGSEDVEDTDDVDPAAGAGDTETAEIEVSGTDVSATDTEETETESEPAPLTVDPANAADFVFVIDSTGSMGSYIYSVRSNLTSFVEYLDEKEVDLNVAVIDYKDITADGINSTKVKTFDGEVWSNDTDAIVSQFASIYPRGGGDLPETPTDAFAKIIDDEVTWRSGAQKFIFLLTDASFKDSSYSSVIRSMDECTEEFRKDGVHVSVVSKMRYEPDYNYLYRVTGGKFIDIDSSDYYKLMIDIADWVYDSLMDSDGDGLPDEWEINGVDFDHDGIVDLHLELMGADPNVKDVFVEVDWMHRDEVTGTFLSYTYTKEEEIDLRPSAEAMETVVQQFKDHGINLHIDAGPDSVDYVTGKTWGELSGGNSIAYSYNFDLGEDYENWNTTALNNFGKERWTSFKYCLFVNRFDNSGYSGIAETIPGQFFIVADVDGWISSTTAATAGTFMHELGHTLGLMHGGSDHELYKPNDLSVMNYLYQTTGLLGTNEINYSEYVLPALDERSLNENDGIDPLGVTAGSGLGAKWFSEDGTLMYAQLIAGEAVDFNGNGEFEEGLAIDLTTDGSTALLKGSVDEWSMLVFKGGLIGAYGTTLHDGYVLVSKYSEMAKALKELDYDTALKSGLLGNPGSCAVSGVTPGILYTNISNQKLIVKVKNLSSGKSSPTLTVISDLIPGGFTTKLSVPASKGKVSYVEIEVPVAKALSIGTYSVICKLKSEYGFTETANFSVNVNKTASLSMTVGKTRELSSEGSSFKWSADNSCVNVKDGVVKALEVGTAVVSAATENGDVLLVNIDVTSGSSSGSSGGSSSSGEKGYSPATGDESNANAAAAVLALSLMFCLYFGQNILRRREHN